MKVTKEKLKQIIEEELKKMALEEADDTISPTGMGGDSRWEKTGRMRPHYTSHGADYERFEPTYKKTSDHPDHPDYKKPPSDAALMRSRCRRQAERSVYDYRFDGHLDRDSGDSANVETVYTRCTQLEAFSPGGKSVEQQLDDYFKDEPWYKDDRKRNNDYWEIYYKLKPSQRKYMSEGKTKLSVAALKEFIREVLAHELPTQDDHLAHELPTQDDTLDLPPGAVEVTDLKEKVKNFLSTKSYTKAGLDDAGRADFVRRHHEEFTQFVLDGAVYHIYGDMMVNSADEEVFPDNPKEVAPQGKGYAGPAKGTLTSYNPDGSVKSMRSTGGYVKENVYSKQANMPLEDEADDIAVDADTDDIMSLLNGLQPDDKLEIINMLMDDLYQANPELADEFDRMKRSP
jgi:hypothetical protein